MLLQLYAYSNFLLCGLANFLMNICVRDFHVRELSIKCHPSGVLPTKKNQFIVISFIFFSAAICFNFFSVNDKKKLMNYFVMTFVISTTSIACVSLSICTIAKWHQLKVIAWTISLDFYNCFMKRKKERDTKRCSKRIEFQMEKR